MPSQRANCTAASKQVDLLIGARLDQPKLVDVRDQRRHAVIAQAARMGRRGNECRAERVHLDQRGQVRRVAEVVGVFAARHRRAGRGLDRDEAALAPAAQLHAQVWERDAGEVRSAADAADDDVRVVARHLELLDRFLAVDRLVQQHMVQHRAQRVFHRRVLGRHFDRLGNRDAERAGAVRVLGEDGPAGIRSRSTARRCSARRRFPSAPAGRASDRRIRAPGRRSLRCRTARRRRRARSPIGQRRSRSRAA